MKNPNIFLTIPELCKLWRCDAFIFGRFERVIFGTAMLASCCSNIMFDTRCIPGTKENIEKTFFLLFDFIYIQWATTATAAAKSRSWRWNDDLHNRANWMQRQSGGIYTLHCTHQQHTHTHASQNTIRIPSNGLTQKTFFCFGTNFCFAVFSSERRFVFIRSILVVLPPASRSFSFSSKHTGKNHTIDQPLAITQLYYNFDFCSDLVGIRSLTVPVIACCAQKKLFYSTSSSHIYCLFSLFLLIKNDRNIRFYETRKHIKFSWIDCKSKIQKSFIAQVANDIWFNQ